MIPKLNEAIEMASASAVPNNMLADVLISLGWPSDLVNRAVDTWLRKNSKRNIKTSFKIWVKRYQARPAAMRKAAIAVP